MKLLLDTNAFLWLTKTPGIFGPDSMNLLNSGDLYLSSISVTEINIKNMLGKLNFEAEVASILEENSIIMLDYGLAHAEELKSLPELIRHDPFDRMLLAQAKCEGMKLITSDRFLTSLGYDWVLDSRT